MYLKTCFQMNVLPEPVVGKLLGAKDDEPKFELAHMSFAVCKSTSELGRRGQT